MKNLIPSNVWKSITSTLKKIASADALKAVASKLQDAIPSKFREKIPQKYQKWILPGLALLLILIIALICSIGNNDPVADPVTGTVTASQLEVHKKAKPDSAVLGQLPEGFEVRILEQQTVDGTDWGLTEKTELPDGSKVKGGWIDLQHIRFPGDPLPEVPEIPEEPIEEPTAAAVTPDPELGTTVMGTVVTGKLNIRTGAGSKYEAVGSYLEGDRIELLEIVTVDDTQWGRTGKGWVGMGYVHMDGTAPAVQESDETTGEESEKNTLVTDGNYRVLGYGVVDLGELNVRLGPGTEHGKVRSVLQGVRYAYYQMEGDWVRIEDGWVSTSYFYIEGTVADDSARGIITTDDLNVRTGPATSFKSNGTLKKGDAVKILGQVDDWGYTEAGWISMSHVEFTYTTGSGTVTSGLNIRKEPDPGSESVGTYSIGEHVTITEVQGEWGKTDKGWINLQYIKYD